LTFTVWINGTNGEEMVPQDALEDVLVIVYYSASWPTPTSP
jgi:hypothetical protein